MLCNDKLNKYNCVDINFLKALSYTKQFIDKLSVTRGDIIKVKMMRSNKSNIAYTDEKYIELANKIYSHSQNQYTLIDIKLYKLHPYSSNYQFLPAICQVLINGTQKRYSTTQEEYCELKSFVIDNNLAFISLVYQAKNFFVQKEKILFEKQAKSNIDSVKRYLTSIYQQYDNCELVIKKISLGPNYCESNKKNILNIVKLEVHRQELVPYGYIWKIFYFNGEYVLLFFFILGRYGICSAFFRKIDEVLGKEQLAFENINNALNEKRAIVDEVLNIFKVDYYLQLKSAKPKEKLFGKGIIKQRKKI